jgi:protein phosphatase
MQALKAGELESESEQAIMPDWDSLESSGTQLSSAGELVPLAAAVGDADTGASKPACPHCGSPRVDDQPHCPNCGWIYPLSPPATAHQQASVPRARIKDRYELGERVAERGKVVRYRGFDHGDGTAAPVPIIIIQEPVETAEGEPRAPLWPGVAWERALLEEIQRPVLPRIVDHFVEDSFQYLVEEVPAGQSLWDAWDEPQNTALERFGWLKQIAGALHQLHEHNAILEALRPDIVVITPEGQARITDLSDLLALPLPANAPIRATCYTAPELILTSELADARADLYSFGAMLYALHLGRELTELDFELQGVPKSILQRFPDIHPLFGRLVSQTFCRDLNSRLPTEDAAKEDPSGFVELIDLLEACRQTLDVARLEIAAWTTTGMLRSGNEDAFALLHAAEAQKNELRDAALILLADGMGGYEAGEVAARMAVDVIREDLLQQEPFLFLTGRGASSFESSGPDGAEDRRLDIEGCQRLISDALKDANRQVYQASQTEEGRRGMGCTVEVVYVNGRNLFIGHVGDSRTYHLQEGRLIQRTRDQTCVNRMLELGMLSPEEAEEHPRRSELQQAIGGYPDVDPALYHNRLKPGDWVVVCSDGLSNQIPADTLKELLQTAASAETAARRLVNLVNLEGAADNATVVVVRAT